MLFSREFKFAGARLLIFFHMQVRYEHIKKITLEFAQEVEDEHLILLKSQVVVLTINFSVDMQLNLIMWYILHLM